MKPISKILAAALLVLSIITFRTGLNCILSGNGIIEFFNLSALNKDIVKLGIIISGFAFGMFLLQIVAIVLILRSHATGYLLALLSGIITLGRGLIMHFAYEVYYDDGIRLSNAPMIIGTAICILTIFAHKEIKSSAENNDNH
jgi:hypothetical protein